MKMPVKMCEKNETNMNKGRNVLKCFKEENIFKNRNSQYSKAERNGKIFPFVIQARN